MKTISAKPLLKLSRYHISEQGHSLQEDTITVEEPLQIRLQWIKDGCAQDEIFTITMRIPGEDQFLATGILLAEGIITSAKDIDEHHYESNNGELLGNQLVIKLTDSINLPLNKFNRRLSSNSSCGLCGKTSLQALEIKNPPTIPEVKQFIQPSILYQLPDRLRQKQTLYHQTGSVHAAGLFTAEGEFIDCAEDIGRHNALDKLIGKQLLKNTPILGTEIILLSGRASFELVQKAVMAGYAVLASVGAPSSLAIETAKRFNLTLIGFVNNQSINVYTGMWRFKPYSNIRSK